MTDADELRRSVDDFYRTLNAAPAIGVSDLAAVAQMRVWIRRFPDEARKALAELDEGPDP